MMDPDAVEREPTPPPPPPRPTAATHAASPAGGRLSPNSQLRADEEYARRLAQHYETEEGDYEARTSRYGPGGGGHRAAPTSRRHEETGLKPNEMWGDKEHSFLDDDLPVIRENLRKGFVDTQNKFNSWFTGIKKRIDEEFNAGDDDDDDADNRYGRPAAGAYGDGRNPRGGNSGGYGRPRRSGDYDADPQVLSDDFAGIQLHGDGISAHNPNLFRPPQASSPRTSGDRKVAFLSDAHDEPGSGGGDLYRASPKAAARGSGAVSPGSGTKTSKWQPMSAVDPAPIAENDPFSLGDSEDEKDTTAVGGAASTKKDSGKPETKTDDEAERLRKAAAEAMADSLVEDKPKA